MTEVAGPCIGVVSDSPLHLFEIQSVLVDGGYRVAIACAPERVDPELLARVAADAWYLSLCSHEHGDCLALLMDAEVPVLFDEGLVKEPASAEANFWRERVLAKLDQSAIRAVNDSESKSVLHNPLLARAQMTSLRRQSARNVWVLGASLGGPEALLEFLFHIPGDLPVSFVYAQHIDAGCGATLVQVMARNCALTVRMLDQVDVLIHGQLGIVPLASAISFKSLGRVVSIDEPWPGPYTPSIDQVITEVADVYRDCAGVIIFSGMGDDGAAACQRMKEVGACVWVQDPVSCVCSAMPEAVLASTEVDLLAGPQDLAETLTARYRNPTQRRSLL